MPSPASSGVTRRPGWVCCLGMASPGVLVGELIVAV